MLNVIVIALSLTTGSPAKSVPSLNVTHENADGSYTVQYHNPGTVKARGHNAARFTADEGNNGVMPLVVAKRF